MSTFSKICKMEVCMQMDAKTIRKDRLHTRELLKEKTETKMRDFTIKLYFEVLAVMRNADKDDRDNSRIMYFDTNEDIIRIEKDEMGKCKIVDWNQKEHNTEVPYQMKVLEGLINMFNKEDGYLAKFVDGPCGVEVKIE